MRKALYLLYTGLLVTLLAALSYLTVIALIDDTIEQQRMSLVILTAITLLVGAIGGAAGVFDRE